MKKYLLLPIDRIKSLAACFLLMPAIAFCQQQMPIAKDTQPTLVSKQFSFTEGPASDREGNIFFTDQPNNKIWEYDINGKLTVFMDSAGRSNGTYFDSRGNLVTCADENGQLWAIDPSKRVRVVIKNFNGHQFNGPNDLWISHKDEVYFTDPYFQRDYWTRKSPDAGIGGEKLYYLSGANNEPIVIDSNLKKPNGVVGIDGKYLFVSDMGVGKIFKYDIGKDGSLSNRRTFVSDLADGMTVDNKGNLYLAGKGVTVYDPTGKKIQHFDVPSAWTANLCFGGKNKDMLFITASESVYIMKMNVRGAD